MNRPHASTAKALLINSARQYDFNGKDHDLTRVHQGWGHPSLDQLYELRNQIFMINEEERLLALESKAWKVEVAAAEINQDGHVETSELDADFALVASGVTFL